VVVTTSYVVASLGWFLAAALYHSQMPHSEYAHTSCPHVLDQKPRVRELLKMFDATSTMHMYTFMHTVKTTHFALCVLSSKDVEILVDADQVQIAFHYADAPSGTRAPVSFVCNCSGAVHGVSSAAQDFFEPFFICQLVQMPFRRAAVQSGGYAGDVFYLRNLYCCVKQLNGMEWWDTVSVMTAANVNKFTLSMVVDQVLGRMPLPADRTLVLDDSMHSYATLPSSLRENQVAWYVIEEMKPRADVSHSEP
jgi:hypothetical protein